MPADEKTVLGRKVCAPSKPPAASAEEAWQQLLSARGLMDADKARRFLQPRLADLPRPDALVDVDRAAFRLAKAVQRNEPIQIFGDFDCDGVAGTALFVRVLERLGAKVRWSVPDRAGDGHGVPSEEMKKAAACGVRVGIAVDTGSSAHEAAEIAKRAGIDLIVCDHHELPASLPEVFALINPMRPECGFAEGMLCGTGVAFFVLIALRAHLRAAGFAPAQALRLADELPLVALATVADVMPLVGANRVLVANGLAEMRARPPLWLRALAKIGKFAPEAVSARTIAFQIAPRINAAGRMRHGREAVRLLLAEDEAQAIELAARLDEDNRARRRIQEEVARAALAQIDPDAPAMAVCSKDWHPGVLGLAAGAIARECRRPAAVGIELEDGRVRFSARAPEGWRIDRMLAACAEWLEHHGGHASAGGGIVKARAWDAFCAAWQQAACLQASPQDPFWSVDVSLLPQAVQRSLAEWLQAFEPIGEGNPAPLWHLVQARVQARREMRNASWRLQLAGGLEAVAFRAPLPLFEALQHAESLELIGRIERNDWNGIASVRFVIEDALWRQPRLELC